jgi:hypothetical protein
MGEARENRARKRAIDKEWKRRGSRKYGRPKMKNSRFGGYSCFCAGVTFVLFLCCILASFLLHGTPGAWLGALGWSSAIFTLYGVRLSLSGMREEDRNHTTSRIGLITNLLVLFGVLGIYFGGLNG